MNKAELLSRGGINVRLAESDDSKEGFVIFRNIANQFLGIIIMLIIMFYFIHNVSNIVLIFKF